MFAVSNAFARDTEIVIVDLVSGRTTTARVTGRLDDQLDILVLLSPAAALPLGLDPGDVAFVRVTIKKATTVNAPILTEDTAPSTDPDRVPPVARNEAAAGGEPAVAETVKTAEAAVTTTEAETVKASETAETVVEAETAEAPAEEAEPEGELAEEIAAVIESGTSAEDAAFLAELAARSPQKQLFLPPREDEMFVYQEPVEPPVEEAAETIEVVAQPEETAAATAEVAAASAPDIASDTGPSEPGDLSEPIALVEAQPPRPELVESLAASAPEVGSEPLRAFAEPEALAAAAVVAPAAGAETIPQAEKPIETAVAAPAAVAAAPVEKPAQAPTASAAVKPAPVQTVLDLPGTGSFTWYLQLAAYSNETLAKDTAARFSSTYPVLVLAPPAGAKPLYRVFVGPLNRAESGTLLAYFRYRGFPDAFVRTAQN